MGARVLTDGGVSAMRSTINWAVLGLLIDRPGYGYDLLQRFPRTYGDALELSSPSQVYGALTALQGRELIEPLPSEVALPVEPRQPKTRYRARAQAVPAYQEWLIAQVTEERQRVELLALLVGALPARDALVVIDRYEQHALAKRVSAPPMLDGPSTLARRLAEQAQHLETGLAVEWAAEARRELEARIDAERAAQASPTAGRAGDRIDDRVALR
jgi:DNA-binding PadR family transcriptional regulator